MAEFLYLIKARRRKLICKTRMDQQQQIQKKTQQSQESKGKFCKVCFDAGKHESIYKSHYVKDKVGSNGLVVCPTLLNQKCRYCHEKGHTIKFCKVLQNKEKYNKKKMRRTTYQETIIETKTKLSNEVNNNKVLNQFASLMGDDSDNEDETTNTLTKPNTWANIVGKNSHVKENTKTSTNTNTNSNANSNTNSNTNSNASSNASEMITLERPKLRRQDTIVHSMSCDEIIESVTGGQVYQDILSSMPFAFKSLPLSHDPPSSRMVPGSVENTLEPAMAYQVKEQQQSKVKEQIVESVQSVQLEYCEIQQPKKKRILNWAELSDSDED